MDVDPLEPTLTSLYCTPVVLSDNATAWILPFTSGGFLYIALVNVMPDLLQESNVRYEGFYWFNH